MWRPELVDKYGDWPFYVHVDSDPGRVALTLRTDRPRVPATTEAFVP